MASPTPPYDTTDTILQFARVIANDMDISVQGNLLSDDQPWTFPTLNMAYRKLQVRLANNSIEAFPAETILSNITAVPASVLTDPGIQCRIGYDVYNDGVNNNVTPVLPQDLEIPLKLWERPTGTTAQFTEMAQVNGGLPSRAKTGILSLWEWRDDSLYLLGSSKATDIRIRYKKILADASNDETTPIPLLRCAVALAYLTVEIFSTSRGGTISSLLAAEREEAIKQIINTTTRKKQRANFRRQPYSRRGRQLNW